ncbi:MAG: hypothetical protein ACOH2J_14550 [Allorhizobium sp.]
MIKLVLAALSLMASGDVHAIPINVNDITMDSNRACCLVLNGGVRRVPVYDAHHRVPVVLVDGWIMGRHLPTIMRENGVITILNGATDTIGKIGNSSIPNGKKGIVTSLGMAFNMYGMPISDVLHVEAKKTYLSSIFGVFERGEFSANDFQPWPVLIDKKLASLVVGENGRTQGETDQNHTDDSKAQSGNRYDEDTVGVLGHVLLCLQIIFGACVGFIGFWPVYHAIKYGFHVERAKAPVDPFIGAIIGTFGYFLSFFSVLQLISPIGFP